MKATATRSKQILQSKANANKVAQQPSSQRASLEPPNAILFEDKRPEAVAQQKLHALANNSPQVQQLRAIQEMANIGAPLLQRMVGPLVIQREMSPTAISFINDELTKKNLGYTWAERVGRLREQEKAELEQIWKDNGGTKKKSPPRKRAAEKVVERLEEMLPQTYTVVAYSNNFDTKHVTNGNATGTVAKNKGLARDPVPAFNTVFKKSYLEDTLTPILITGQADGNLVVTRRASDDGDNNIGLAERKPRGGMKAIALGIYQYDLHFTIATSLVTRTKTVTFTHMTTA